MEEVIIRGVVMGVVLGLAGFIANLIWKAVRSVKSSSEGSRRVKLLAKWGFALVYVGMMFSGPGMAVPMIALAAVVGAVYWVRSGTKK